MVVGLLGNENPDLNRFTLVTPKPANGVRLQATLGNQNPTDLPVGAVRIKTAFFGKTNKSLRCKAAEKVCAVYLAVLFYLTIHFVKVIKIIKKRNWI